MEHMQHVTLSLNYLLHKFRIVAFFFFQNINIMPILLKLEF